MIKFIYKSKIHPNHSINYLIMEEKKVGIENLINLKAFTDYSQTTDDVYENLEDYNPTKKRRMLIVFDNIIADMGSNKKLSPIVTEFFLRESKLSTPFFYKQSTFDPCPENCLSFSKKSPQKIV